MTDQLPSLGSDVLGQIRSAIQRASGPALRGRDFELSYQALDAASQVACGALRAAGIGPQTTVATALGRSADAVIGILGLLKAGAVYLPLDDQLPTARRALMVRSADARVLLHGDGVGMDKDLLAAVPGLRGARLPSLRELLTAGDAGSGCSGAFGKFEDDGRDAAVRRHPGRLAYIVFTSGSTGTPKPVAVTDAALARVIGAVGEPMVCAWLSPVGFDVSLQELVGTLATGGTLVLPDGVDRRDPRRVVQWLADEAIERLHVPPALLHPLASAWVDYPRQLAVREVLVAGDTLRVTGAVRQLLAALPGVILENQYGPAESHHVTTCRMQGGDTGWPAAPPIGRPIASAKVYLLDGRLRPVSDGDVGELYLGDGGLALGYWSAPATTAERFVADPFSEVPGGRMYRTGDLARRQVDGELEFFGRADRQVKVGGNRVEPAEIEAALVSHSAVAEAAVGASDGVVASSSGADQRLVAYLVLCSGMAVTSRQLRRHLSERLPRYMVPERFVRLPELPTTVSGKVDHRALGYAGEHRGVDLDTNAALTAAPRNDQERLLAGIWAEVLPEVGGERLGIDDDFFDLGGRSVLAAQIMFRIRRTFGVDLPIRVLFDNPTIRRLTEAVEEAVIDDLMADAPNGPRADDPAGNPESVDARATDGSPVAVYLALPPGPEPAVVDGVLGGSSQLLELGCGVGRHTRVLTALGHRVTAVDDSPAMLAHVTGADVICADITELRLDRAFDAVVLGSHLINVLVDRRGHVLRTCAHHVAPGGAVLVQRFRPDWTAAPTKLDEFHGVVRLEMEPGVPDDGVFRGVARYTVGRRSWQQEFVAAHVPDELLIAEAALAGLALSGWADEEHTWAVLRPA